MYPHARVCVWNKRKVWRVARKVEVMFLHYCKLGNCPDEQDMKLSLARLRLLGLSNWIDFWKTPLVLPHITNRLCYVNLLLNLTDEKLYDNWKQFLLGISAFIWDVRQITLLPQARISDQYNFFSPNNSFMLYLMMYCFSVSGSSLVRRRRAYCEIWWFA
jgi:hypothetical protein